MQSTELALKGGSPVSHRLIRMAQPRFGESTIEDLRQVLSSGALREDTVTKRFEDCFATRIDARYAYAVSSGTAALHLALMSCTNKGKEVIVPAFTFFASASTVIHSGRRPVLVDVAPETFLMDTDMMNEAIGDETAALMPVHLFGNMVDLDVLGDVAEDHGLTVVHDCAQSLGSTYRGWDIGSFDDMCCFSFYPTKIITTGEGGMVTTNSEELSMKGRRLKSHGESEKYLHEEVGYNYRFTEVGSVLGLSQMRGIERFLERRRATAMYYDLALGNIGGLEPQAITPDVDSCYNYYTVRMEPDEFRCTRDQLVKALRSENIETGVHYPSALTQQPALKKYASDCPVAESLAKRVFSIPIHPGLSSMDAERVIDALRKVTNYFAA